MDNTNKDWFPSLAGLHKGQNASKIVNCFKTDIPNLAELPFVRYALQSKVPMSATTSRLLQYSECNPMLMPKILLLTRVILESFQKEKGRFFMPPFCHIFYALVMLPLTPSATKTRILGSTNYSPRFGAKNKIYNSLLLFICHYSLLLFTCYWFFLFKGGCPLYFKQVFSVLSSGLLP